MTRTLWQSAFVAAVFALHPLHVESVAWIAERKDVLSTFLGFLTLLAYTRYWEKPAPPRYLLTLSCFAFALLAKPMMVTLPFVLLLLDFWPLGRMAPDPPTPVGRGPAKKKKGDRNSGSSVGRLLREKIPFLVLAAVSSAITLIVQRAGGAVVPVQALPVESRLANALLSYVRYLGKICWPEGLAVFYPYPSAFPLWKVAAAGLFLAGVTGVVVRLARRRPYLSVGWFWFLGTLVPVIGIVQVGLQSMADRYTYFPMIGILIAVAWGASEIAARWKWGQVALWIVAPALLLMLSVCTQIQVRIWRNTMTLFARASEVTDDNFLALNGIGSVLADREDYAGALRYYEEATKISPAYAQAQNNLGIALYKIGRLDDAMNCYREALRLSPGYSDAHYNLGVALFSMGRLEEAISSYRSALRFNAQNGSASYNLAVALAAAGRTREAEKQYSETLGIIPDSAEAHNNIGILLFNEGRIREAIAHFTEAVRLRPEWAEARRNLNAALSQMRAPR
jgi:tetratricopeptide (TPR) repeat protein